MIEKLVKMNDDHDDHSEEESKLIISGLWKPKVEYGECGYDPIQRSPRNGRAFGGQKIEPGRSNHLALLAFSDLNEQNTLYYHRISPHI